MTKDGKTTQYGIAWPLGNVNNGVERYLPLLFDHGGTLFNKDQTRFTLDTPEAISALEALADLFKTGVAPTSSLEVDNTGLRELFLNRRIAMYYSGPFDVQPILEAGIKFGTGPLPGVKGMGVTTVDGFSLIVPAHSSKQKAAEQFVAFVGQPKNQARLTATFPASYTALKYEQFNSPYLQPFVVQLGRVENMPNHPKMERARTDFVRKHPSSRSREKDFRPSHGGCQRPNERQPLISPEDQLIGRWSR